MRIHLKKLTDIAFFYTNMKLIKNCEKQKSESVRMQREA